MQTVARGAPTTHLCSKPLALGGDLRKMAPGAHRWLHGVGINVVPCRSGVQAAKMFTYAFLVIDAIAEHDGEKPMASLGFAAAKAHQLHDPAEVL